MTTNDDSNDRHADDQGSDDSPASDSNKRLFFLIGLLALALFALWYDYKVARPAVERAYESVIATNVKINTTAEHRRMTNVDVQNTLGRGPSETFPSGIYMIEAYRWNAGMPIELRGLNGDESPGIGLKTHDYYAVYRKDGPNLAFVTHYKFDLDVNELAETRHIAQADESLSDEEGFPSMAPSFGGNEEGKGGGPGRRRRFDPETLFSARDEDGDGKLAAEEIPEGMLERIDLIDTDGDGSISKEELIARIGRPRDRGGPGGRPGRDGGDGEGRRQRPPLEASGSELPEEEPESNEDVPAVDSGDEAADGSNEPSAGDPLVNASPTTNDDAAATGSGDES